MHKQNVLILSVTLFALAFSTMSLGMFLAKDLKVQRFQKKSDKSADEKIGIIDLNPEALIFKDNLILVAAGDRSGQFKNGLNQTCKYFNKLIAKTNPYFVGLQTFVAQPRDINDIVLSFSWHNTHPEIVACIKGKMSFDTITFPFNSTGKIMWSGDGYSCSWPRGFESDYPAELKWSGGGYKCSWPLRFESDYPAELNKKYIKENENAIFIKAKHGCYKEFPSEAEKAIVFAALCKDVKSVQVLAEKIKLMICVSINTIAWPLEARSLRMNLHKILLDKLIEHDDIEAFELIVKHDPYDALNIYLPQDQTRINVIAFDYEKPYLDNLMNHWLLIPHPGKKSKYVQAYRACGGLTFDELNPDKLCIIS